MISRRQFLKGLAAVSAAGFSFGGYAAVEPFRLNVTRYAMTPPGWRPGHSVRLAVLADFHFCDPWMSLARCRQIVARANALGADAILLLGDYVVGHRMGKLSTPIAPDDWALELAKLKAPLGVYAVLGNHDWWDEYETQVKMKGPVRAGIALEAVGIPVYENKAIRLEKDGRPFWLAGLGDQWAFWPKKERYAEFKRRGKVDYIGVDDLAGTLAQVTDDAPVVLMAHEPDIFPTIPVRVSLTISGHTHGGQFRMFGYSPVVPSKYGSRYIYGHIVEEGRNLIVSGGLGCSVLPLRFGSPPEIVVIDLGKTA